MKLLLIFFWLVVFKGSVAYSDAIDLEDIKNEMSKMKKLIAVQQSKISDLSRKLANKIDQFDRKIVNSIDIEDGSIQSIDMKSESVNASNIEKESISSSEIKNGSIATIDLMDNSVNSSKADLSHIQKRITGACTAGIKEVKSDGTVDCRSNTIGSGSHSPSEWPVIIISETAHRDTIVDCPASNVMTSIWLHTNKDLPDRFHTRVRCTPFK
ncbi:hypothetical protein OAB57_00040 [Bacteriovoracaceae bacterium]|nr:hypothetical protein [Bacteriovoracaceae bacterium]